MERALSTPSQSRPTPGLLGRLWTALTVARQRHRLAQLDDRLLKDIGIDSLQAEHEAQRPLWDVPSHWTK